MDLDNTNELHSWAATVRRVDSNLHAAFARQHREASRKQPFWKRTPQTSDRIASVTSDLSQPVAGIGY